MSPDRITSTVQPISKFRERIYSILCKVALATFAPSIFIGSSIPTGETTPLFPVCQITSINLV